MTEEWRVIPFATAYEASSLGRVRRVGSDALVAQRRAHHGYMLINLTMGRRVRKTFSVHRLVARTFFGECPNMVVDHIDEDKTNNSISNLRYVTVAENLTGRNRKKTTRAQVDEIIRLRGEGYSFGRIAETLCIKHKTTIDNYRRFTSSQVAV